MGCSPVPVAFIMKGRRSWVADKTLTGTPRLRAMFSLSTRSIHYAVIPVSSNGFEVPCSMPCTWANSSQSRRQAVTRFHQACHSVLVQPLPVIWGAKAARPTIPQGAPSHEHGCVDGQRLKLLKSSSFPRSLQSTSIPLNALNKQGRDELPVLMPVFLRLGFWRLALLSSAASSDTQTGFDRSSPSRRPISCYSPTGIYTVHSLALALPASFIDA